MMNIANRILAPIVHKLIAYPFSVIYYFFFSSALFLFHPIQIIALRLWGWPVQKITVDALNFMLLRCLNLLGTRMTIDFEQNDLPKNRPLIFASNHQSTYDIPPLIWYLRRYSPKFVAKKNWAKDCLASRSIYVKVGMC